MIVPGGLAAVGIEEDTISPAVPIATAPIATAPIATAPITTATTVPETSTPLPSVLSSAPSTAIALTTVDELSDVLPTDWAYLALQRLVEQYGCVAGYPDGTFRGDRALSRYEFAAVLDACLSVMVARIPEDLATNEDLATLQRLQETFQAELDALRAQVDNLEARAATLEANQFSTTTRLQGEIVFSVEQLAGDERPDGSGAGLPDALTFSNRVRLNFNTSFTGRDLLKVRLDALDPPQFNVPATGTNMTRLAFDRNSDNDLDIGKLFYRFPVGDRFSLHIDAVRGAYQANVSSTFHPGFAHPILGAVSRFGRFNPIYYQGALGTGITGVYDISDELTASVGYLSRGRDAANPEVGLFQNGYTALAQLDFRPSRQVGIGLTYAHSYYPSQAVVVSAGTGSRRANAPFSPNVATSANHFGVQSRVRLGNTANLSGWAGVSLANAESSSALVDRGDAATILNWAVSLGLPDVGSEGSLVGLLVGNPPRVLDNDGGPDEDDATWHIEAFYRYRLNRHISLIPGVFVLVNPENDSDNDTIVVSSFRTVFQF
ncbi:MAG: iron uptake porin [Cyanothece sp. SIO2G6]|nr:iron uptake porin [Cyanothece sp. SIO2G6]